MIVISVPRRERRLPRVLDPGQVEQIVAGERKPRDRAILALPAYGGLRRGEGMAADVGDYSREAPSLMVHGKGNKDRVVPLHAVAQAALDAEPTRGSARDPDAARARVAGHHRDLHAREPGARAGGRGATGRIAEWTLTTLARVPVP
jgi:site-specific recombinase XerC